MPGTPRSLSLTPAHVAQVHRTIADGGPGPGAVLHSDGDYDERVERMIRSHPAPGSRIMLFAFGSLIWRPEIEYVGEKIAPSASG
nr:hypothetical protein [Ensifer sp. IC4062]